MGIVYLASDSELKRIVALKVLSQDRANNPTLVRRFKSEGQAAALLKHENIVSVYEAGQADGHLFLALEYVEGIDLLEWVNRKGSIPVKRSVEIMRQAAQALQHAYERNIVHRDIKPSNLMVSKNGTVKLTDMGLARSIDETLDTTITRDGTTVGTVDYMAPEQASNSKAADIRSDIYSLGCTWYHLLTGKPPYSEGSVTNKITSHISSPIPDPRLINPNVPEAIVAVIHRMLAKKKEKRYQTPAELLEDLNSPMLRQTQDVPNLLVMFGEDLEDKSSDDLIFSHSDPSSPSVDPPNKTGNDDGKTNRSPSRKSRISQKLSSMPTRAELPVTPSSDPRQKLVRMNLEQYKKDPVKNLPWGLIVMGLIIISVVIGIRMVVARYLPEPEKFEVISPYERGATGQPKSETSPAGDPESTNAPSPAPGN